MSHIAIVPAYGGAFSNPPLARRSEASGLMALIINGLVLVLIKYRKID